MEDFLAITSLPEADIQVYNVWLCCDILPNFALETVHCTHSMVIIIAPSYSHTVLNRTSRPHKVSKGGAEDCDAVKCFVSANLS